MRGCGKTKLMPYSSISATELAERLKRGDALDLIDVREPFEFEIARVEGARLLPLSRSHEWLGALDAEREIVVMCHHGIRSARVCAYLSENNFAKVFNLDGGIDAWSTEVDRAVPRY